MTKLKDILRESMTEEQLALLPKSFDVIGDIAVINIPDEIIEKESVIGSTLLRMLKHVNVIVKKTGIHHGEFRVQQSEVIAGEQRKETTHKENGVKLKLDIDKCYFSPRLCTERLRIAKLVKPEEDVLVMFSGVAPYPLVIAKNSVAKSIVGVELNPIAHRYGFENVQLNKIFNIKLYNGDVKEVVPKLDMQFDRIVMPLPKTGDDFLDTAFGAAKKGTVIHFYDFSQEKEFPDFSIAKVKKACSRAKLRYKLLNSVKCGAYSPYVYRVCIDFQII